MSIPFFYNATRHGCCALDTLVLPGESLASFYLLETGWRNTYHPSDDTARGLVDQLISADWLHQRSNRACAELEAKIYAAQPDLLQWTDDHHKALTRFQRYRTANQNAFTKARRTVEDHFKSERQAAQSLERLTNQQARLKVYEVKNAPEPTFDEIMADMKRLSIEKGYATEADYGSPFGPNYPFPK